MRPEHRPLGIETGRPSVTVVGEPDHWPGPAQPLFPACSPPCQPQFPQQSQPPGVVGGPDPCPSPAQGSLCPQCRCRPGFRLKDDGRTCADVDECSTTFPCSQRCVNTHGSYKCLCVEGYAPRGGDPHSCKAVTGEPGAWRASDGSGSWGPGVLARAPAGN